MLGDIFWQLFGRQIVEDFNPEKVNPSSYECHLGDEIILQVFRGVEMPDVKARLTDDGQMIYIDHVTGQRVSRQARFDRGDAFLAHTVEYFRLGRFVSLQWLDKSSTGREGLSNRHAGHVDPGFSGQLTLEYDVFRTGYIRPFMPIGQVVASLTWSWTPYNIRKGSKYVGQTGANKSRNRELAFENRFDFEKRAS